MAEVNSTLGGQSNLSGGARGASNTSGMRRGQSRNPGVTGNGYA